jgi:hypothetical protein
MQCNAGGIKMIDSLLEMLFKIMLCFNEVRLLGSYIHSHLNFPSPSAQVKPPGYIPSILMLWRVHYVSVFLRRYLWQDPNLLLLSSVLFHLILPRTSPSISAQLNCSAAYRGYGYPSFDAHRIV